MYSDGLEVLISFGFLIYLSDFVWVFFVCLQYWGLNSGLLCLLGMCSTI
jgi:hypothetical protein